jgi:hypothetical protein
LNRLPVWTFAFAAIVLVALWQWATVAANYSGNWTALFFTGDLLHHPPLAGQEHIYSFPNSFGYDGQFYRYIAHDPFLRSDLKSYVDDPRLRYHRILLPFLAYALAWGHSERIDPAYGLVCLLSIGLGVYWSCRFAQKAGLNAAWGLVFLAMPAIPVTMDRLVIDGGMAALTAAFLYYRQSPSWKLFAVLLCAALTRETGFLLVLAYCVHLVWRRELRMAGVFLLSAAPAAAWYGYVQSQTAGIHYSDVWMVPYSAVFWVMAHPLTYPDRPFLAPAILVADYLAWAGMLLGIGLAFYRFARKPRDPMQIAAALFAAMASVLQRTDIWANVYAFGRVYTPLLLCLAAAAAQYRKPWLLTPLAMTLPRLAIQFVPQVWGILRWAA